MSTKAHTHTQYVAETYTKTRNISHKYQKQMLFYT